MPTTGPLATQNIKDRYFGVNDPVANKMMDRVNAMEKLEPPEDQSVTTLFVGGITADMQESDIQVGALPSFPGSPSQRRQGSDYHIFVSHTSALSVSITAGTARHGGCKEVPSVRKLLRKSVAANIRDFKLFTVVPFVMALMEFDRAGMNRAASLPLLHTLRSI